MKTLIKTVEQVRQEIVSEQWRVAVRIHQRELTIWHSMKNFTQKEYDQQAAIVAVAYTAMQTAYQSLSLSC